MYASNTCPQGHDKNACVLDVYKITHRRFQDANFASHILCMSPYVVQKKVNKDKHASFVSLGYRVLGTNKDIDFTYQVVDNG